jgi:hypothetical protein
MLARADTPWYGEDGKPNAPMRVLSSIPSGVPPLMERRAPFDADTKADLEKSLKFLKDAGERKFYVDLLSSCDDGLQVCIKHYFVC